MADSYTSLIVLANLKDWDEAIHRAIAHPARRRVIEILLEENELSFNELLQHVDCVNHGKFGYHMRLLRGLIEYNPLTKKYRLTDRGLLTGELLWDTRSLLRRGRDIVNDPMRYARRLRLKDHAALFYETEEVKRGITFPYLEAGLLRGEAVVYLVSEHKLDSESHEIQIYGIGVDCFQKEAFTVMSAEGWYLEKGKAQAETIIDNYVSLFKERQKAGFTGLRVAAETEAFFKYAKTAELLRYEADLGRQLTHNICGLCIYDARRLDEEQFIQLNKTHGHSIFKGIGLKTM